MATPPPVVPPPGTELPPQGQGSPPYPYQYPYPPPIYYYPQPPKKNDSNTIIIVVVVLIGVLVVVPAILAFAVFSAIPGWGNPYNPPNPGPTKSIGVYCVKSNATAYKCGIASADAGVDFGQVRIDILDGSGRVIGSWPSPIEYPSGSGGVVVGSAKPPLAPTALLTDNGDLVWGVGDDVYLGPASGSSLVGCSILLDGKGGRGSAMMN